MKRLTLFVFLFICTIVASAQQRALRVSYASVSKIAIEVSGYSDEVKKQLEEELKKHTEQRETSTLLQNGTRSTYTIVGDESINSLLDTESTSLVSITSFSFGGVQSIYLDLDTKEKLTKKAFMDKDLLVKESLTTPPQWKIGTETKEILGKKCTKATLTVPTDPESYGDKKNTHKNNTSETYTAWFCKEIPVPFGPEGMYGLPGLIMETIIGDKTTTATKIEYLPQSQPLTPPKGKTVTPEEFDKMQEESLTRFLETNENTEWEIQH